MTDPDNLLSDLPRESPPPSALKGRVAASLRARGRLTTRRPGRWAVPLSLAAAVILFSAGVLVGRRPRPPEAAPPSGMQYVLLLYEDAGFHVEGDPQAFVAEYRAWGEEQGREGHLVGGEKLAASTRLLEKRGGAVAVGNRDVQSAAGVLAGYFIITAADYDQAVAIARTHPHLRHGGRIAIREIEPT